MCEQGTGVLHDGALGTAVVARVRAGGGFLTDDDIAAHRHVHRCDPVSTTFRGSTVWELPPPTQGLAVLEALRRDRGELAVESVDDWRVVIDAMGEGDGGAGFDLEPDRGPAEPGARATPPTSPRSTAPDGRRR